MWSQGQRHDLAYQVIRHVYVINHCRLLARLYRNTKAPLLLQRRMITVAFRKQKYNLTNANVFRLNRMQSLSFRFANYIDVMMTPLLPQW